MPIQLDLPTIGAIVAVMTPIVGGATWAIDMRVEKRMSDMELRLRDWINGSFLRSSEVEAKLAEAEAKIAAEEALRKELRAQVEDIKVHGCARYGDHLHKIKA